MNLENRVTTIEISNCDIKDDKSSAILSFKLRVTNFELAAFSEHIPIIVTLFFMIEF